MGKLIDQFTQLYIKLESPAYTWAFSGNPAQADFCPAYDIRFAPSDSQIENPYLLQHYGRMDDQPGQGRGSFTFKTQLAGSGAGVAPLWAAALKACGMAETVSAGVSVTYKPSSTQSGVLANRYSVLMIKNGRGFGISGAVGAVRWLGKVGQPVIMEFTFRGPLATLDVAKTAPTTPTIPTAPIFSGGSVVGIPSWSGMEFTDWMLDLGNNVEDELDANSALGSLGYKGTAINGRRITGSVNPLHDTTYDALGAWRAGTTGALGTGVIGTAGNRFQFLVPRAQYNGPSLDARNGFVAQTWPFDVKVAANSAEGDDFSLVLT